MPRSFSLLCSSFRSSATAQRHPEKSDRIRDQVAHLQQHKDFLRSYDRIRDQVTFLQQHKDVLRGSDRIKDQVTPLQQHKDALEIAK